MRDRLTATEALLDQAEAALAPEAESGVSTFLGAFAILLREGLEALLVVIAMIAFLRKAERPEALPYVHGGWVAALRRRRRAPGRWRPMRSASAARAAS